MWFSLRDILLWTRNCYMITLYKSDMQPICNQPKEDIKLASLDIVLILKWGDACHLLVVVRSNKKECSRAIKGCALVIFFLWQLSLLLTCRNTQLFYCKKFPGYTRWYFISWREYMQLAVGGYVEAIYEVVPEDAWEFLWYSTKAWTAIR